eukprot:2467624-Amphidinium_carterae.1
MFETCLLQRAGMHRSSHAHQLVRLDPAPDMLQNEEDKARDGADVAIDFQQSKRAESSDTSSMESQNLPWSLA